MSNTQQPAIKMWSGRFLEPLNHTFQRWHRSLSLAACVGCCIFLLAQHSAAQTTKCSQPTIDRLETESDGIRDWSKLREFYHRYRTCRIDDAEVTEGVSESVARMLADHWDTLPVAARLFKQDPTFEAFALAGLNITDLTDDLNHIDNLAAEHCPANLHVLCRKIRDSIRDNK
jgi:hypothetical protein